VRPSRSSSPREPLWFHAPDRSLLLFAGLYESWKDPRTSEWRRTFTIVTTAANRLAEPIHDRMPAMIGRDVLDAWLTGDHPELLLAPAASDVLVFQLTPPSTQSNQRA
jgi:putative SOS response-associated peptidase YedK